MKAERAYNESRKEIDSLLAELKEIILKEDRLQKERRYGWSLVAESEWLRDELRSLVSQKKDVDYGEWDDE